MFYVYRIVTLTCSEAEELRSKFISGSISIKDAEINSA